MNTKREALVLRGTLPWGYLLDRIACPRQGENVPHLPTCFCFLRTRSPHAILSNVLVRPRLSAM